MKKKNIIIAVLALALVLTSGIQASLAYFTTYAEAKGGKEVKFGYEAEIEEKVDGLTKAVTITVDKESIPVCARVRALIGAEYEQYMKVSGDGWSKGDDRYWYYGGSASEVGTILNGGDTTSVLNIKLEGIPEEDFDVDTINLIVMYETTPVFYDVDTDGNATAKVDWSMTLDSGSSPAKGGDK